MAGKIGDREADLPRNPVLAYSVAQAAKCCDLSERTLRDYIRRGELKVSRAGRRVLIRPERLKEFLLSLEVADRDRIDERTAAPRRKP